MSNYLPGGIGETLGDTLTTVSPLFLTGDIWYVLSTTGDNSYSGLTPSKPFATLAQAVSSSSAGDIIVLLDGHTETIATQVDVNKALIIVASGETNGKPTVKLTDGGCATSMIALSAANSELRNIWFEEPYAAASIPAVAITATGCRLKGCYFETNGNNDAYALTIATSLVTQVKDCTFISNAATITTLPLGGVSLAGGVLFLENNVFDDNDYGFIGYAFLASAAATIRGEGNSFLNGARFSATESSAQIVLASGTFTGSVQWLEA